MKLSEWLAIERGRGLSLASAIGVPPTLISQWSTTRVPPFERCIPIERATDGLVTRRDLRPDDWQEMWPELAQAQAERAPAATELVAVSAALLEKLEHQAEDQIALLVTDARVQIKNMAGDRAWDGVDRRTKAWDGVERRTGVERRQPEVLEAPVPALIAEAVAMARLKTGG